MSQKNSILIFVFLALLLPLSLVAHPVKRVNGDVAYSAFSTPSGYIQYSESATKTTIVGKWNDGFVDGDWANYKILIVKTTAPATILYDLTPLFKGPPAVLTQNGGTEGWRFDITGHFLRTWNKQTMIVKHNGVTLGSATINGLWVGA
ncbi:2178_t:CDS:1 [Paraglomus brasilianum]|uniref:2178_t:CDS:1 n=1 Tax=Paraglomus brasilianum TaxID=144538 RepID=A0A9N9FDS5_9GLOM|nr:2178_t:CDS:1 [Paraglomus brasilianum]